MVLNRRQIVAGGTCLAFAGADPEIASAQSQALPPIKIVRTPILEIGFHEFGPPSGFPVLLLHGFPDDALAYAEVAPVLASAGHRIFAVYLRGFGPTRFLDPAVPRTAEQAALGQDVMDFADALKLSQFVVRGGLENLNRGISGFSA